jgi:hypothetical protein
MIIAGKTGAAKAKWAQTWQYGAAADMTVLANINAVREWLNSDTGQGAATKLSVIAPLWQGTSAAVLSVNLQEQLEVALRLTTAGPIGVEKVRDTLAAVATLGQNSLSQMRITASHQPGGDGAALLGAIDMLDSLLDSVKIVPVGNGQIVASATVDADEAATLANFLLPAISKARDAARRAQSTNNLKQLALAMYNYHDVNQSFPPAVLYGPDGKTPYSWRVALLPYLDQAALFQQYRQNEPWDSPANRQVLLKMPAVFRDPNDSPDSIVSSYYAITGPSTIFFGDRGARVMPASALRTFPNPEITDGTSNTLMLVEAKRDIPWTKPEDIPYTAHLPADAADAPIGNIPYAKNAPLPKFGGHYAGGFLAAIADGRVQFISNDLDPAILRAAITRDGGEPIGDALDNPQPARLSPPGELMRKEMEESMRRNRLPARPSLPGQLTPPVTPKPPM